MTERNRGAQLAGATNAQEAIDLTELHASKTVTEQASTDLAQASIQSKNFVRLSARPEKRSVVPTPSALDTSLSQEHQPSSPKPAPTRKAQRNGIFKNPYYRYEGGPLGRLIALIANILKVIEQAILRVLTPNRPPPPVRKITVHPTSSTVSEKREDSKDKDQRELEPRRE